MEVSGQVHATAALRPGNDSRYPLNSKLGGPQRRPGRFEEENNLLLCR
jgi:hypothetical protein